MSTTYYMRLKDNGKLDKVRYLISITERMINSILETQARELHNIIQIDLEEVLNKDDFNKQFCNAADWYASYPDEPEDYHLKKVFMEDIPSIEVNIGTNTGSGFHWHLSSLKDGYYDTEEVDTGFWEDKKCFNMPRSKEQLVSFMNTYKDKVEIVDEYGEVYTVKQFLKKVNE